MNQSMWFVMAATSKCIGISMSTCDAVLCIFVSAAVAFQTGWQSWILIVTLIFVDSRFQNFTKLRNFYHCRNAHNLIVQDILVLSLVTSHISNCLYEHKTCPLLRLSINITTVQLFVSKYCQIWLYICMLFIDFIWIWGTNTWE